MSVTADEFESVIDQVDLITTPTDPNAKFGNVYFIACKETRRCKIGFTAGDVNKRLKNLQTGSAGKLRLIAAHPGTVETERQLHSRFAEQRLHGEWFEVSPELFAYMCATVWVTAQICVQQNIQPWEWVLVGLRMLNDDIAELPEELAALIAEPELVH